MSYDPYIKMQKSIYENPGFTSEQIVGNYAWHEEFPYESLLLYINGDIRKPIFDNFGEKVALDFACGPGRMVPRMKKLFSKVDGADISKNLIEEARIAHPTSNFFVTNGDDLGETPRNSYDFVYSTIALQHIAVRSVRLQILKGISAVLKQGGKATLQMAYSNEYPFKLKRDYVLNDYRMMLWKKDKQHAAVGRNDTEQKRKRSLRPRRPILSRLKCEPAERSHNRTLRNRAASPGSAPSEGENPARKRGKRAKRCRSNVR
jgi:SAM-dependent methyltransferase